MISEVLEYCKENGVLRWKEKRGRVNIGDIAGCVKNDGYRWLRVGQKTYSAHRIAWFLSFGDWPKNEIDHINGDKDDNRISNLRDVDKSTNMQNCRKPNTINSLGILGVSRRGSRFRATIRHGGKSIHIGYFNTADAAHHAYIKSKRNLHNGCSI